MRKSSILITGILSAILTLNATAYSTYAHNLGTSIYHIPDIYGKIVNKPVVRPDFKTASDVDQVFMLEKKLGVVISSRAYARKYGVVNGAFVEDVIDYSPAGAARIRKGDLITEINGFNISTAEDLILLMYDTVPGQKIVVTVAQVQEDGHFAYDDLIVRLADVQ